MIKLNIDALRRREVYSKAALARKCGIPYSTMLRLCSGQGRRIRLSHLAALCTVLHCRPSDILCIRPNENDESDDDDA